MRNKYDIREIRYYFNSYSNNKSLFIAYTLILIILICFLSCTKESPKPETIQKAEAKTEKNALQESKDSGKRFIIKKAGNFGFIDESGKVIIKPQYNLAENFSDELALVKDQKGFKFIDKNGSIKIDEAKLSKYDEVYSFKDGYAFAKNGRNLFIIDKEVKIVQQFKTDLNYIPEILGNQPYCGDYGVFYEKRDLPKYPLKDSILQREMPATTIVFYNKTKGVTAKVTDKKIVASKCENGKGMVITKETCRIVPFQLNNALVLGGNRCEQQEIFILDFNGNYIYDFKENGFVSFLNEDKVIDVPNIPSTIYLNSERLHSNEYSLKIYDKSGKQIAPFIPSRTIKKCTSDFMITSDMNNDGIIKDTKVYNADLKLKGALPDLKEKSVVLCPKDDNFGYFQSNEYTLYSLSSGKIIKQVKLSPEIDYKTYNLSEGIELKALVFVKTVKDKRFFEIWNYEFDTRLFSKEIPAEKIPIMEEEDAESGTILILTIGNDIYYFNEDYKVFWNNKIADKNDK